jgi:hypothetical protein
MNPAVTAISKLAIVKTSSIAHTTPLVPPYFSRIDRWIRLDRVPERNRMEPRPGMVEGFHRYLQQRWAAGCRHGRTLLAEIRERGYVGAFSTLAKCLSPWRQR